MKRWTAVAIFAVAFPLFSFAEKSIPRAGETIEVSIVNLDVVVTDKKTGERIHGLTKDDFEVYEDGKTQPISNFAAYAPQPASQVTSSGATLTTATETAPPKRQPRTLVVFVEHFKMAPFRVHPIFEALRQTLHQTVMPGDSVLIATWNMHTAVRQDYTDDMTATDKALDEVEKESIGASFDVLSAFREETESMREWLQEAASAAGASGMSDSTDLDWAVRMNTIGEMERERTLMIMKAQAVNAMISSMANDEGRKAVILLTRRMSRIAGGEFMFITNPGSPLATDVRARYATYNLFDMLKATANAHGVTVYGLIAPGLEDSTTFPNASTRFMPPQGMPVVDHQVLDNELASMSDLTESTGGTLAWGTVDISNQLPRIRDDFEDYYSLAYRIGARNDDRARKVVVKTKNPRYLVRTRKQYMEKSDDGRIRDQVIASLFRPTPPTGINIATTIGKPAQRDKHHYVVPVTVRVPVSAFMTSQDGEKSKGAFSVYIATGRVIGETSDIAKQTIPFSVADVSNAKDGYFTYDFQLLTDFTTNRMSIAVYDEVSHDSGLARVDLYQIKR